MTDLPHTNAGYVQKEETDFRRATDTVVMKKIGRDQNYLKDFRDALNTQANALFGTTCQASIGSYGFTTDGSANFQGPIFTTPQNQQIVMAFVWALINGFAGPWPLTVLDVLVQMGMIGNAGKGGTFTPDTGTFPLTFGQLTTTINSNDTLYGKVLVGNNGSGFGLGRQWTAGTGGTLYYSVIYKTT